MRHDRYHRSVILVVGVDSTQLRKLSILLNLLQLGGSVYVSVIGVTTLSKEEAVASSSFLDF